MYIACEHVSCVCLCARVCNTCVQEHACACMCVACGVDMYLVRLARHRRTHQSSAPAARDGELENRW